MRGHSIQYYNHLRETVCVLITNTPSYLELKLLAFGSKIKSIGPVARNSQVNCLDLDQTALLAIPIIKYTLIGEKLKVVETVGMELM